MVESQDKTLQSSSPASAPAKPEYVPRTMNAQNDSKLYLCMTGVEKHGIEKDIIKFLRKFMSIPEDKKEENKDEKEDKEVDLPLKGVAKKRGNPFAFLQFEDLEQKKKFMDDFGFMIAPRKNSVRLKEVNKIADRKFFKPIKGT